MKRKFMMLSMLISGPRQPRDDIGTYLAPPIEDLKLLWKNGVECYDANQEEIFNLRVVLLWTINDFPAYGNLSGFSVKGYKACPICGDNTSAIRLKYGKKMAYLGHQRFLARNHPYRHKKKSFNGEKELKTISEPLSGEAIYSRIKDLEFPRGKKKTKKQSIKGGARSCWNRVSSFFEQPYWKDLHVRHCLDVMHIEKNICMNILSTLLDIPGKSKDGSNARRDLVHLKIRPELAPINEKRCVLKTLSEVKVPKGYSFNVKNLVSMTDLSFGLKSHDCHVLLQQLFPIAIRSVLPKHVRYVITQLCIFFNLICNKVVDEQQLENLEEDIVATMCLLEKYFPPSFFTIMMHRIVHIVREVKLCGPVYLRWMYPFERYMKVLKNYVRNRHCPEGCIAECYIVEEAIEFCSDFLSEVDPVGLGIDRLDASLDNSSFGRPLSAGVSFKPKQDLLYQAHQYVLANTIDVQPYIEYLSWYVASEIGMGNVEISDNLRWIAHGPYPFVIKHNSYAINGCRYHTESYDKNRSVQNSGVSLVAKTMQVSSSKDKNPIIGDMSFYGVIQDIWKLNYNTFNVAVFRCD
ncbi:hypothetical protein IC582_015998 [Cucumis melo]